MTGLTRTGYVIGTFAYMSPEQFGDGASDCSDAFSLAVMLYQFFLWMPTSPYHADGIVAAMDKIQKTTLKPLADIAQNQHPFYKNISLLLQKALVIDPKLHLNVKQLHRGFTQILQGQKINVADKPKRSPKLEKHYQKTARYSSKNKVTFSKKFVAGIATIILLITVVAIMATEKIEEKQVTTIPKYIWEACWNSQFEIFDFTKKPWLELDSKEQGLYASLYQKWYAKRIKKPWEKTIENKGISLPMRLVPPGRFFMDGEKIVVLNPYYISQYEITQSQYNRVNEKQDNSPKTEIFFIGKNYISKFLKATDSKCPTEVQWEYACRGGTTTRYYTGKQYPDKKYKYKFITKTYQNPWDCYGFYENGYELCYSLLPEHDRKNNKLFMSGSGSVDKNSLSSLSKIESQSLFENRSFFESRLLLKSRSIFRGKSSVYRYIPNKENTGKNTALRVIKPLNLRETTKVIAPLKYDNDLKFEQHNFEFDPKGLLKVQAYRTYYLKNLFQCGFNFDFRDKKDKHLYLLFRFVVPMARNASRLLSIKINNSFIIKNRFCKSDGHENDFILVELNTDNLKQSNNLEFILNGSGPLLVNIWLRSIEIISMPSFSSLDK